MSDGRATMSIGQVLEALKPEFPDISVSKIRFLEGEGLIAPERTASGYRKFAQRDIDRLRVILRLQRDSFLPLKVIRERLLAEEAGMPVAAAAPAPAAAANGGTTAQTSTAPPLHAVPTPAPTPRPAEEDELAEPQPMQLTEADLAATAGLEPRQVKELRDFGVLCAHTENGSTYFDADDLAVGTLAGRLLALGLDARHLRTLRRFAEQEAGLFEQLVTPAMRNRRPEVREQAATRLGELAKLAREFRTTLVRKEIRSVLNGDR